LEAHTILGISAYASGTDPHSTMVAIIIQPDRADWVHVGDSRLYFFRQGSLYARTADHTLAAKFVADGTMTADRAALHPHAGHLWHTLGGTKTPVPSHGAINNLKPGDRFLLCSDGLWSYFSDQELAQTTYLRDLREGSRMLIEAARQRAGGHGDNCSLVLLGITEKP
jgi:PPM family protein phosphatase